MADFSVTVPLSRGRLCQRGTAERGVAIDCREGSIQDPLADTAIIPVVSPANKLLKSLAFSASSRSISASRLALTWSNAATSAPPYCHPSGRPSP